MPLFNKGALKNAKVLDSLGLKGNQIRIIEVSKKFLTKDNETMKVGIKETAKTLFKDEYAFNPTLEKFDDLEKLRLGLINAHKNVLRWDFLSTNLMVGAIPWMGNAFTKMRTKRSGYSGTYKIADEDFTKKSAEKRDKTKKYRQAATLALALLPGLLIPPLLSRGMKLGQNAKGLSKWLKNHAHKFDYDDAVYMSRLTGLIMWVTSDYFPYQLACRDKYEYRDTVIRGSSIGLVFWGGDLLLKRFFSKGFDKLFKTNLMNKEKNRPFKFKELKNPENFDALKKLSGHALKKTRNAAVGLYALNLLTIMVTLGFGLPYALNRILRKSVKQDMNKLNNNSLSKSFEKPDLFKDFKI